MKAPGKIRVPRPPANEVPWVPPYQYECSTGRHSFGADHPMTDPCPVCVDGLPCGGSLVRFGPGSRTETDR